MIDLRSDTVTRPTAAMRAAMHAADVGDDVYGDDPGVNHLQDYAAERFGFEAALWFASGTQSNLAALMSHCGRGGEMIVGQDAHTYRYEQGGAAVLGSIQPQPIVNQPDGSLALRDIAAAIKPDDLHFARTRLLALENTIGGKVLAPAYVRDATMFAKSRGLATHLDGARLMNAVIASGQAERDAVAGFDTVSLCLSKGLGAPAGSLLLGNREVIKLAKRWRKALGGGLRQAGIYAAAGLHALEHHVTRLADDHANAAHLAAGLAALGLKVEPVQTNMVFVEIASEDLPALTLYLPEQGVLAALGARTRLVTHLDVSRAQIDAALAAFGRYYAVKQHAAATFRAATRPLSPMTGSLPPGLAELYGSTT
ncbi:MAG: low-specificity L-threonine aldolase [Xanthomonadaceae bacterium]|nr:low-specificity L-threonine aldolase [Xanthomonadaceae bacterium]